MSQRSRNATASWQDFKLRQERCDSVSIFSSKGLLSVALTILKQITFTGQHLEHPLPILLSKRLVLVCMICMAYITVSKTTERPYF